MGEIRKESLRSIMIRHTFLYVAHSILIGAFGERSRVYVSIRVRGNKKQKQFKLLLSCHRLTELLYINGYKRNPAVSFSLCFAIFFLCLDDSLYL